LAGSGDGERRSSGRAILLLLGRVEELERELAGDRPSPPAELRPSHLDTQTEIGLGDPPPLEDTQPIGLRDRLRLATGRRHER
jgi:hypothetical protein